jgi:hypothetical protein
MPSNLEKKLKNVLDQFAPDILGAVWISNEELSMDLLGFDEFNYLFDGLISQYLYGQEQASVDKHLERSSVFYTKNFDQNIFLIHLQMRNDSSSLMADQNNLIQKNKLDERKKILLFNQTKKYWGRDLQIRYPDYDFIDSEFTEN